AVVLVAQVPVAVMGQQHRVASFVPGSWPMKLLAGNPTIVKPSSRFASYRDSSASYCGVSPHFDATLTTSTTLPARSPSDDCWPSMVVNGISWMSVIAAHHGPGA